MEEEQKIVTFTTHPCIREQHQAKPHNADGCTKQLPYGISRAKKEPCENYGPSYGPAVQ